MFTVSCPDCGEAFTAGKISDAMTERRIHAEQRHRVGKIETDTSLQR